ncbi:MAG: DUF1249 domain-containing protein [Pseudomonadales bacterium]
MLKKKYSIDLAGQMAECEANYARIMQLLPDMEAVDQREFGVDMPGGRSIRFQIVVRERCKYTTMVDVSQLPLSSSSAIPETLQQAPCFSLRVYHDARMAEVIAYNRHQRLRPSYNYPNNKMYHRDEKAQLNTFLGEWLSHCLQYGYALGAAVAINT